jgi:sugar phosphate isomerase/epimerase
MRIDGHDIGVCSWSLRPANLRELAGYAADLGLTHVQLALGPLLFLDNQRKLEEISQLRAAGLTLTGGMIAYPGEDFSTISRIKLTGGLMPDDAWPVRKQLTLQAGRLAAELGLQLLTVHIGFVPPSNHEDYAKLLARVTELVKSLQAMGVALAMETGQESASELLQFLNDLPSNHVGVNFDPANMILYGSGNPLEAVKILGRHIRHVHLKDAIPSKKPGLEWGVEVPVGAGQVNIEQFLLALKDARYPGPLLIEREAGANRLDDIRTAIATLKKVAKL